MALFSERYGYTNISQIIIRERITPDIQNTIHNSFYHLSLAISSYDTFPINTMKELEKQIWIHYLNNKEIELEFNNNIIENYWDDEKIAWYDKLNLLEAIITFLFEYGQIKKIEYVSVLTKKFIEELNKEFERLKFAYRVIDKQIAEITSEEEIVAIEEALSSSSADNIRTHLNNALKLYAQKPIGDYRNSIKESITAVEAISRNITGDKVLNFAKMEKKGVTIPSVLRQAFEKLYGYTNDEKTGIRHALMDDEGSYVPKAEEALFMLVSCSAFINYLNKKTK